MIRRIWPTSWKYSRISPLTGVCEALVSLGTDAIVLLPRKYIEAARGSCHASRLNVVWPIGHYVPPPTV